MISVYVKIGRKKELIKSGCKDLEKAMKVKDEYVQNNKNVKIKEIEFVWGKKEEK